MLSTPKLIAATAVLAAGTAAAVVAAAQTGPANTARTSTAADAPAAVSAQQPVSNDAPLDEAMNHMTDTEQVSARTGGSGGVGGGAAVGAGKAAAADSRPVFLAAELNGRNEVPTPGQKVGDRDGRAVQVIQIQGKRISFAIAWKGIAAPTAAHIHEGAAGVNGAVKVPFFATALPNGVSAVTGSTTVDDAALLKRLTQNPERFYANLHTAEFKDGAVRDQFRRLDRPVDLDRVLTFGTLVSKGNGANEVPAPNGGKAGDRDGRSLLFVSTKGGRVDFSARWTGIAPPTAGHIHQGRAGVNGAVVVPLFAAENGLPATINGLAGTVNGLDRKLTDNIGRNPEGFYTNIHTAEFKDGAVRDQLSRVGPSRPDDMGTDRQTETGSTGQNDAAGDKTDHSTGSGHS